MQRPPEAARAEALPRLYLIGAGVSFPEHLTFQTVEILKQCVGIYTNLPPQELDKIPNILRSKVTGLWGMYIENRDRTENYREVVNLVFEAAAKRAPIAWLTPGHPIVFDSVSQALLRLCGANNVLVSIVPAISSFDTVLAQLGFDPADGMFIYEASAAFEQNVPLNERFATFLLQPSAFGSALAHYSSEWMPDLRPLGAYLAGFYGLNHRCALVRSLSQAGASSVTWRTLATLHEVDFDRLAGSTLFVPPRILLTSERGG